MSHYYKGFSIHKVGRIFECTCNYKKLYAETFESIISIIDEYLGKLYKDMTRYGQTVKQNDFITFANYITIKVIRYNNKLYYVYLENGDVIEITEL